LNIHDRFLKNTQISIVQWEPSCSTRTNGRTDKHNKATSRFSKFCERP